MHKLKFAGFLFLLFTTLNILGIVFKIPLMVLASKPFIILSLLFLYSISVTKLNNWYVFALVFSSIGDVLLLFKGEIYFMTGLFSFLTAHAFFIKIVLSRIEKVSISGILTAVIPSGIFLFLLIFTLKDSLGELFVPVIIYGFTISTFGALSLIAYLGTKSNKYLWMLIGAIVFMVSDSILAIDKFHHSIEIFGALIMGTYIIAQYFIYRSMILDTKKKQQPTLNI